MNHNPKRAVFVGATFVVKLRVDLMQMRLAGEIGTCGCRDNTLSPARARQRIGYRCPSTKMTAHTTAITSDQPINAPNKIQ